MTPPGTTLDGDTVTGRSPFKRAFEILSLTIVWCSHDPSRVGEVFLLPNHGAPFAIGRSSEACEGAKRLLPVRQRPDSHETVGPLSDPHLSRHQITVEVTAKPSLRVVRIGKRRMAHQGIEVDSAVVAPGETIQLGRCLLLLCEGRPWQLGPVGMELHAFGQLDRFGMVGESAACWDLRRQIAALGTQDAHALVQGESGAGKELVARALHILSRRAGKSLVSRNAATLPESLIDAELFGNARDYPNVGMPARPGLVGEAEGSTLYFDEIGEMPESLQSHLLRVLDAGEYQRLGEAGTRRSDFRFVGSTRQPDHALREDLLARMPLRIHVPGLEERAADVPLIAQHLLASIADRGPARRFYDSKLQWYRISAALTRVLVQHPWSTHVRELEAMLRLTVAHSQGDVLDVTPALFDRLKPAEVDEDDLSEPGQLPPEVIQAALDRHDGVQEKAWRDLGLSSRHVLARLIRKYGLRVPRG